PDPTVLDLPDARGLDSGHGRHVPGGRPGRDRTHRRVPGHQPAVVPGRVRRADRADPGGPVAGPAVRRVGGGLPGRRGGRHRPGAVGLSGPAWVGWVNVVAGWLAPYLLGIAWALGSLRGRRVPALMLAGGAAATAALIAWVGYPASMVGVNGA